MRCVRVPPASSHQIAASKVESLRPLLPARPAALGDEEVLVQDSLDGQGNQNQLPAGPPALPMTRRAYWFNTSPKATQDLPRVTQDLPAPSAAAGSRQEVLLLSPLPVQETSCGDAPPEAPQCGPEQGQQEPAAPAQVVPASGMSGPEEAEGACGDAPAQEEQAGRRGAQGVPTPEAASAPPGTSPSPMVPPPGKENESTQTPAAVKVKGGKEKRASGGAAPGCAHTTDPLLPDVIKLRIDKLLASESALYCCDGHVLLLAQVQVRQAPEGVCQPVQG